MTPEESMMNAVGVPATRHRSLAAASETRIVGTRRCIVLAAAAGVLYPLGPLSPASMDAVTICAAGLTVDRKRFTSGSASMQCGQVLSQNTTAVGLPNMGARVSVPLPPPRLFPERDGALTPIKVVGSRESAAPGATHLVLPLA